MESQKSQTWLSNFHFQITFLSHESEWENQGNVGTFQWFIINIKVFTINYQFSCSVVSISLRPHELQHARPPCLSPTPRVHPNSCPSSWWCHPAISSSVIPFSSCPQSLSASGSFQWVNSSHEVAKVLEFQLQHQSFQRTSRTDLL